MSDENKVSISKSVYVDLCRNVKSLSEMYDFIVSKDLLFEFYGWKENETKGINKDE